MRKTIAFMFAISFTSYASTAPVPKENATAPAHMRAVSMVTLENPTTLPDLPAPPPAVLASTSSAPDATYASPQSSPPTTSTIPPHRGHTLRNVLIVLGLVTVMYILLGAAAK
jgi:hypothetical protein